MATRKLNESLADLWKAIVAEEDPGIYLFELKKFPEIEMTPNLLKEIFEFNDGYFVNHLIPTGILDFREEKCDFGFAESYSKSFGLGREIGLRSLEYRQESDNSVWRVVIYLLDYNSIKEHEPIDIKRIADLNQPATTLISSLLVSPIIGKALRKSIIGLLYEIHGIDYSNLETLFRYFVELKKQRGYENIKIHLFIVSEKIGRNQVFFNEGIQRAGIIKNLTFMKTIPYSACVSRIPAISSGITKDNFFVLLLGAGVSGEARTASGESLPLGDDLKKIAIKSVINKPELENETIEVLEEKFRDWLVESRNLITDRGETHDNVNVTLERVLHEELKAVPPSNSRTLNHLVTMSEEAQPPIGYTHIRKMIEIGYHPIIITTNYDTVFERFMGKVIEYYRNEDYINKESELLSYLKGENDTIPILKIHGSLTYLESIKESVNNTYKLPTAINELMLSIYNGKINNKFGGITVQTFFIGYSFRDEDVCEFFRFPQVWNKMKAYIVNPSPTPEIRDFFLKNKFSKDEFMQTIISIPFSNFTKILLEQL